MTATTYTFPTVINSQASDPFHEVFSNVGNLYSQSMQSSMSELWMGSAKIVQEHSAWALTHATQECMAALVQNAYDVQQRTLARLGTANQKAVEMMTGVISGAVMPTSQVL